MDIMDPLEDVEDCGGEVEEFRDDYEGGGAGEILEAGDVFLLMSRVQRISRNRRAEWFFNHLNKIIQLSPKESIDECTEELTIISILPKCKPPEWTAETCHLYRYKIVPKTIVNYLSRKYRYVICFDVSPSVSSVDVQNSNVMFDGIFEALNNTLEGLMQPFFIPGSKLKLKPKIYLTILAHCPFLCSFPEHILVQGILLDSSTYKDFVKIIFDKLSKIENKLAEITNSLNQDFENSQNESDSTTTATGKLFDDGEDAKQNISSTVMSSDFGLVDLLRHCLIALNLLPENSTTGIIIITDGVVGVPDGGYLDVILSQLRYNTVSCSFINLSSPFHPHQSFGILPYSDFMKFISASTFGAFFTNVPEIKNISSNEMNIYHRAFLNWNFQRALENFVPDPCSESRVGEWKIKNKCFTSVRDMPILQRELYRTTLNVNFMKVLSCRLREGFTIKEVNINPNNTFDTLEVKLTLPWKFLIHLEYYICTSWPEEQKIDAIISIEGPYDFLHDVTCLVKKPFNSYYRQLMISRFWSLQKNLSESDKLLAHFNSFSSNPNCYNIPDSLRNGVPVFYVSNASGGNATNPLQTSVSTHQNFLQFWKPVCLLDITIWQKWMHTHRIGMILQHDIPLPKNLHISNSSGRFPVIQCRQTVMNLNTLLKNWSSFVLVENHSYVKLIFDNQTDNNETEQESPIPCSFYIIRVTSRPPHVVLRLAFLVGTSSHLRNLEVSNLKQEIENLQMPHRLKEPSRSSKFIRNNWSDTNCCILLNKPLEKILIRYEGIPRNFFKILLPQSSYNISTLSSPKHSGNSQSTFGFRPTYPNLNSFGSTTKMGPEMFNTVARYLNLKRWIWALQNSASNSLNVNCGSRILSTLTKMRLQEGFRFAYSSGGTLNMIMELKMKSISFSLDTKKNEDDDEEIVIPAKETMIDVSDVTPCIFQYVIFPPTNHLFSHLEEEDDDDDDDEDSDEWGDDQDKMNEMYLITETWVEPQCGYVVPGTSAEYLDNLEYFDIAQKVYEIDRDCVASLSTFEYLNIMCQDDSVLSPSQVQVKEILRPKITIKNDDQIKAIPFIFEIDKILTKSKQAEILFSLFNQDLSLSFAHVAISTMDDNNEFDSLHFDRANLLLYESWIQSVVKLHDRELILGPKDNEAIYKMILSRDRDDEVHSLPFENKNNWTINNYPRWKCFLKGLSSSRVILVIFPESYNDLKLLMLANISGLDLKNCSNNIESTLGVEERTGVKFLEDEYYHEDHDYDDDHHQVVDLNFDLFPPNNTATSTNNEDSVGERNNESDLSQQINSNSKSNDQKARKRCRVKSGGDSGPVSKINRKNSIDNTFRLRTSSVDGYWSARINARTLRARTKSADQNNTTTNTTGNTTGGTNVNVSECFPCLVPGEQNQNKRSSFYYEERGKEQGQDTVRSRCASMSSKKHFSSSDAPSSPRNTKLPLNHKPKYGSITLPVYVYDCSLPVITDHLIFQSTGKEDIYIDCRVSVDPSTTTTSTSFIKSEKINIPGSGIGAGERNHDVNVQDIDEGGEKSKSPEPKSEDSDNVHDSSSSAKEILRDHCFGLEMAFAKSYVSGMYDGLINHYYIHKNDVQIALSMCSEYQVEIDLTEFIQTLCRHFKEAAKQKSTTNSNSNSAEEPSTTISPSICLETCSEISNIHSFVKKSFLSILFSTFNLVPDYSDIYFYNIPLDETRIEPNDMIKDLDSSKIGSLQDIHLPSHQQVLDSETSTLDSKSLRNFSKDDSECKYTIRKFSNAVDSNLLQDKNFEESYKASFEIFPSVPLFMYMTCSFQSGDKSGSFVVRYIPTCILDIIEELDDILDLEKIDVEKSLLSLEFIFLTIPPEIDLGKKLRKCRSFSTFSASSHSPKDEQILTSSLQLPPEVEDQQICDDVLKGYPQLPQSQLELVEKVVEDVKWLLMDEITSQKWESSDSIIEETLDKVAHHIQISHNNNKPGCTLQNVDLIFVNNLVEQGFENFKQRFRNLPLDGYKLHEVGNWIYLMDISPTHNHHLNNQSQNENKNTSGDSQSQVFEDSHLQHRSSSISSRKERFAKKLELLEKQQRIISEKDAGQDDEELSEIVKQTQNQNQNKTPTRKLSGTGSEFPIMKMSENCPEQHFETSPGAGIVENIGNIGEKPPNSRYFLATPSQLSEISSLVESVITNEGYDGDGSESGGCLDDGTSEINYFKAKSPPFWLMFKVLCDRVIIYFHCRYNEDDLRVYMYSNRLRNQIYKMIINLRRIVNQDLLLQNLHDTKNCSNLLEIEDDDEDLYVVEQDHVFSKNINQNSHTSDNEHNNDGDFFKISPGIFSCSVVWETRFVLHPRLRTGGPGISLNRGIQTLKSTMIPFLVMNRQNMFVYRNTLGNVFYMRMYKMQEIYHQDNLDTNESTGLKDTTEDRRSIHQDKSTSSTISSDQKVEDIVLLQVRGITESGVEIKEQLVPQLQSKLDESVLDILSVLLDRNPHCKLSPDDVHFIQKPFQSPDSIIKYKVNSYALQYLPAFAFYLHQNLLQFLYVPKYTDSKAANHFQDYTRYREDSDDDLEKNIYLYNQSPGGTGFRAISAIAVALNESSSGQLVGNVEWKKPSVNAFSLQIFNSFDEIAQLTLTEELHDTESTSLSSGEIIILEFRLWKQGRVNFDLLKNLLSKSIQHSLWDLAMEFYFLTCSLSVEIPGIPGIVPIPAEEPSQNQNPPVVPTSKLEEPQFQVAVSGQKIIKLLSNKNQSLLANNNSTSNKKLDFWNFSTRNEIFSDFSTIAQSTNSTGGSTKEKERRNSTNFSAQKNNEIQPKPRSMSFSARKPTPAFDTKKRASSPLTLVQGSSKLKSQIDIASLGLTKYDSGECGQLHDVYGDLMKKWAHFGHELKVPSLRSQLIDFQSRNDVEIISNEIEKIIQIVSSENSSRQFWKDKDGTNSNIYFSGHPRERRNQQQQQAGITTKNQNLVEKKAFDSFVNSVKSKSKNKNGFGIKNDQLVQLFASKIDENGFNPSGSGPECIIASRNVIYWKCCLSTDPVFESLSSSIQPESHKNAYKFSPLLDKGSKDIEGIIGGTSSKGSTMNSRVNSTTGLLGLLNEPEEKTAATTLLVPRQRFLLIQVEPSQISLYFYNWSKDTSDRLIEHCKVLGLWLNAKSCLLSSILAQKVGLFSNQPLTRISPIIDLPTGNPFCGGGVDFETLIRCNAPPKEVASGRISSIKRNKSNSKSFSSFLESYRNLKHVSSLKLANGSGDEVLSTLEIHGCQLEKIKNLELRDSLNLLSQLLMTRGKLGYESVEEFKKIARVVHYCMTPIIFQNSWRSHVAATRDNTIGIIKKPKVKEIPADLKRLSFQLKMDLEMRSRHGSGNSQKSDLTNKKSIWTLWGGSNTTANSNQQQEQQQQQQQSQLTPPLVIKKMTSSDNKWHTKLCQSFIQEYQNYLQTHGYMPIHHRPQPLLNKEQQKIGPPTGPSDQGGPKKDDKSRHVSGASTFSTTSGGSGGGGTTFSHFVRRTREESGDKFYHYLQKTLSGGIIIFELFLDEPFFSAKMYALEASRIQMKNCRKTIVSRQNLKEFLQEIDKMKILMHLHSFAFDFHLRNIHSYISGRNLIFQGNQYHLTNFLDDFIKYYPKGPNFARNAVQVSNLVINNVTTPAQLLYNYILSHESSYKLRVMQMHDDFFPPPGLLGSNTGIEGEFVINEFVLVQNTTKKVVYKDIADESQYDDFDLTLIIGHDVPPMTHLNKLTVNCDPSVLRLKYYILLTSRRELYPKLGEEKRSNKGGKLCIVNTPEILSSSFRWTPSFSSSSKISSRRTSADDRGGGSTGNSSSVETLESPRFSQSQESQKGGVGQIPQGQETLDYFPEGIREEQVHYMGYFSSHEFLMKKIVDEQIVWVESYIRGIVSEASVDCRRDLLWQRLLVGGQHDEKNKNKKEDLISRETIGALTYWEFVELLELVQVRSLSEMDPNITTLLRQPITFYQNLLKLLTVGNRHFHRHFVAPDNTTHQMAIFSPNDKTSVVMLEINFEKKTAELSLVSKMKDLQHLHQKQPLKLEGEILNLIESVVNNCAYCSWLSIVL